MLMHFLRSINWVDVGLAVLLIRIVFIGVKNGLIPEIYKIFGVFLGIIISFHVFSLTSAILASRTSIKVQTWEFLTFVFFCAGIYIAVKFLRDGLLLLFRVESNHQGFDKYAGGMLAAGRAIWVISCVLFALLLVRHDYIQSQTRHSLAFKGLGWAAANTYKAVYQNVIAKLFENQKYNSVVDEVLRGRN